MELSKIPIDIVNYILSFDSRFVIVKGVAVYIPFKERYRHIIELLQNKPYLEQTLAGSDRYIAFFTHKKLYVYLTDNVAHYYRLCHPYEMLFLYSN